MSYQGERRGASEAQPPGLAGLTESIRDTALERASRHDGPEIDLELDARPRDLRADAGEHRLRAEQP
jgi:hypothetical protein